MTPDANRHNPDHAYLRGLLLVAAVSQREAARRIGVSERTMRYYLAGARDGQAVARLMREAGEALIAAIKRAP